MGHIGYLLKGLFGHRWRCWPIVAVVSLPAMAAEEAVYSSAAGAEIPRRVLWGDTHVHSNLSLDANMSGNATADPATAYRFARGETVTGHNGMKVRLRRPLDFLLVSDHAEYVGVLEGLRRGDRLLMGNETASRWGSALAAGDRTPFREFAESLTVGRSLIEHPEFQRTVWERMAEAADRYHSSQR